MVIKRFILGLFLSSLFHLAIIFSFSFQNISLGTSNEFVAFEFHEAINAKSKVLSSKRSPSMVTGSSESGAKKEAVEVENSKFVGKLVLPQIPYPTVCQKDGIEGSVFVKMNFDSEGKMKSIEPGPILDSCPQFTEVVLENLKKFKLPKELVEESTSIKLTIRFKINS